LQIENWKEGGPHSRAHLNFQFAIFNLQFAMPFSFTCPLAPGILHPEGAMIPAPIALVPSLPAASSWSDFAGASQPLLDALSSTGRVPLDETAWAVIASLGYVQAALFIAVGLVYLLCGYKVFRVLVVVNAAVLGAWMGHWIGVTWQLGWWPPLAGAAVLAIAAWPLLRVAVCLTGGSAGALLGVLVAGSFTLDPTQTAVAALAGGLVLGLLSFVIFKLTVIGSTALLGSLMTVLGVTAVCAQFEELAKAVHQALHAYLWALPVMVIVPAIIGLVYQISRTGKENK
jgi:hypothetical protein